MKYVHHSAMQRGYLLSSQPAMDSYSVVRTPILPHLVLNVKEVDAVHLGAVEVACSGLIERLQGVLEPWIEDFTHILTILQEGCKSPGQKHMLGGCTRSSVFVGQ